MTLSLNKSHHSWLISTNNPGIALSFVQKFISDSLFESKLQLSNNPDFKLITRVESLQVKNISIEQIRELQKFLQHTPAIGKCKVVVIYQAELMTLSSANSCLKLLEEASINNSYVFLITTKPSSIIQTIKSRCVELQYQSNLSTLSLEYYELVKFLSSAETEAKIAFINKFSDKNREEWAHFANHILLLTARIIKKLIDIDLILTEEENLIARTFKNLDITKLLQKYNIICELIDNTIKYDLELRNSSALLHYQLTNN